MEEVKYTLDSFEGPLDLLLTLIKKNKVSIWDIPIVEITDQYLEAIAGIERARLDDTSEFIVLASQLLYIKSKMLLPRDEENRKQKSLQPEKDLPRFLGRERSFFFMFFVLAAYRGKTMSTKPVNIQQTWNLLSTANQKHALTYMEFLYHQQQESEKKTKPLPYDMSKEKMVIPEGFDDPMPECEEYR